MKRPVAFFILPFLVLAIDVYAQASKPLADVMFPAAPRVEMEPTPEQKTILQHAHRDRRTDLTIKLTPDQKNLVNAAFGIKADQAQVVPLRIPHRGFKIARSSEESNEFRDFYYFEPNKTPDQPPMAVYVSALVIHNTAAALDTAGVLTRGRLATMTLALSQQETLRNAVQAGDKTVQIQLTDEELRFLNAATGHHDTDKVRNVRLNSDYFDMDIVTASETCRYHTECTIYCRDGRESCSMLCVPVCECRPK